MSKNSVCLFFNATLVNQYILFGSYGGYSATNPPREVYFSQDNGETWDLVYEKNISDMNDAGNFHIHDVAFDPYSNAIIVSEGDNVNRQISYSYDFGETWETFFDTDVYGIGNPALNHPTSILCFPEGIAFGSDELPEGISWWERPIGVTNPPMGLENLSYKITFNEEFDNIIGTYATKGDTLQTSTGFYGIMPFKNHETTTEGYTRLYATGDGGRTWHEIFRQDEWSSDYKGFFNAFLREETDGIYIYGTYSKLGRVQVWKAKMPNFYID